MFCYQCQETAKGQGCVGQGICGKNEQVADLQDLLVYTVKGISEIITKGQMEIDDLETINEAVLKSLFMTVTNANFDGDAIKSQIRENIRHKEVLLQKVGKEKDYSDAAAFTLIDEDALKEKARQVGVFTTDDDDIRSLRELITYGLKGMAAYAYHAYQLGEKETSIYQFIYETFTALLDDRLSAEALIGLTLKTGEMGVEVMALLDEANTSMYGNPEITSVNTGVFTNPGILISGHDLKDLEMLLEQTKDQGIDVYTHCEMLPAHYYPFFKSYPHLVGNYGGAWWKQREEFEKFKGPILFTSNCIVPPQKEEIIERMFTTGSAGFPGAVHIEADSEGKKDFSPVIAMAKKSESPQAIEEGVLVGGFAHEQVFKISNQIVEAIKSKAIRKFVVMAGCDGRSPSREYYTEFAKKLPQDVVILTAGCAKYRYNKLPLKDIGAIPRVLDAGQCNDSYSLALIALKLKDVFNLEDVNELPIAYNIAWYEQKAVIVLLALLSLGIKNIHLGPTLPAFLSPDIVKVLVDTFGLAPIGTVDEDLKALI